MEYITIGVLVVAWCVAAFKLLDSVMDCGANVITYVVAALFSVLSIAGVLYIVDSGERKGPCVKYETQMHYNAATKTMMPARVCVLRGEWVKGGEQ